MWQIKGLNLASPKLGTPTNIPNLKFGISLLYMPNLKLCTLYDK